MTPLVRIAAVFILIVSISCTDRENHSGKTVSNVASKTQFGALDSLAQSNATDSNPETKNRKEEGEIPTTTASPRTEISGCDQSSIEERFRIILSSEGSGISQIDPYPFEQAAGSNEDGQIECRNPEFQMTWNLSKNELSKKDNKVGWFVTSLMEPYKKFSLSKEAGTKQEWFAKSEMFTIFVSRKKDEAEGCGMVQVKSPPSSGNPSAAGSTLTNKSLACSFKLLSAQSSFEKSISEPSSMDPFLKAVCHNDLGKFKQLIQNPASVNVNAVDKSGRTALMCAVDQPLKEPSFMLKEIVRLWRDKLNPNLMDKDGKSALTRIALWRSRSSLLFLFKEFPGLQTTLHLQPYGFIEYLGSSELAELIQFIGIEKIDWNKPSHVSGGHSPDWPKKYESFFLRVLFALMRDASDPDSMEARTIVQILDQPNVNLNEVDATGRCLLNRAISHFYFSAWFVEKLMDHPKYNFELVSAAPNYQNPVFELAKRLSSENKPTLSENLRLWRKFLDKRYLKDLEVRTEAPFMNLNWKLRQDHKPHSFNSGYGNKFSLFQHLALVRAPHEAFEAVLESYGLNPKEVFEKEHLSYFLDSYNQLYEAPWNLDAIMRTFGFNFDYQRSPRTSSWFLFSPTVVSLKEQHSRLRVSNSEEKFVLYKKGNHLRIRQCQPSEVSPERAWECATAFPEVQIPWEDIQQELKSGSNSLLTGNLSDRILTLQDVELINHPWFAKTWTPGTFLERETVNEPGAVYGLQGFQPALLDCGQSAPDLLRKSQDCAIQDETLKKQFPSLNHAKKSDLSEIALVGLKRDPHWGFFHEVWLNKKPKQIWTLPLRNPSGFEFRDFRATEVRGLSYIDFNNLCRTFQPKGERPGFEQLGMLSFRAPDSSEVFENGFISKFRVITERYDSVYRNRLGYEHRDRYHSDFWYWDQATQKPELYSAKFSSYRKNYTDQTYGWIFCLLNPPSETMFKGVFGDTQSIVSPPTR